MVDRFIKRPVVVQVLPELSAGGAEQGCIDMAEGLVRNGAEAIVVSNGGRRVGELKRIGAEHISLPVHAKNPVSLFRNTGRLKELILERGVHIIHARSRAPAWAAYYACMQLQKQGNPVRFMTTCHAPYNQNNTLKKKYNSVMARGERVIAISHFVADYLRENFHVTDDRLRIVHRGISLERFHPKMVTPQRMIDLSREWRVPDGAEIILLPGRLTRWKGHHVLIEAMAQIKNDNIFCVMIGDDQGRTEYRKELEQAIEAKGLSGKVRLIGHCKDMPAAYMMSAVVVSASIDPEGFGRVPVEAQAMGCPVIATDHGGARETVYPEETGWLVPPGTARELTKALDIALSLTDRDRAILATRAMTNAARNFSREQMMGRTLDIYGELLEDILAQRNDGGGGSHESASLKQA